MAPTGALDGDRIVDNARDGAACVDGLQSDGARELEEAVIGEEPDVRVVEEPGRCVGKAAGKEADEQGVVRDVRQGCDDGATLGEVIHGAAQGACGVVEVLEDVGEEDVVVATAGEALFPEAALDVSGFGAEAGSLGVARGVAAALFVNLDDVDGAAERFLHIFCHAAVGGAEFEDAAPPAHTRENHGEGVAAVCVERGVIFSHGLFLSQAHSRTASHAAGWPCLRPCSRASS